MWSKLNLIDLVDEKFKSYGFNDFIFTMFIKEFILIYKWGKK